MVNSQRQKTRKEADSLGVMEVPKSALWGAETERALKHFSVRRNLMPPEMIPAYAIIKRSAAFANHEQGLLCKNKADLIMQVCDEILDGRHDEHFPLGVWMTGSGTPFNMNVNEVIANRCAQIAGMPLGGKEPIHPNDDVNKSQSSNDTFPAAMHIAAALSLYHQLIPAVKKLRHSLEVKVRAWKDVVKLGRTHLQDATPLTLGQEFSGYTAMLQDNLRDLKSALHGLYPLALGGTAVGTGLNTHTGFDEIITGAVAQFTTLPFRSAKNKFSLQGAHHALVYLASVLKGLAVSLYKIANDIRLLSCGPRAGLYELLLPANEPGSSIMPGKVNPTQCEALSMIAAQVIAAEVGVTLGGAGGHLEMNAYKPLIIFNVMHALTLLTDGCDNFEKFLVRHMKPNFRAIAQHVEDSLMLVTALSPLVGHDKASEIADYALKHDLALRAAALKLGHVTAEEFDRHVHPLRMCHPCSPSTS